MVQFSSRLSSSEDTIIQLSINVCSLQYFSIVFDLHSFQLVLTYLPPAGEQLLFRDGDMLLFSTLNWVRTMFAELQYTS